MTLNMTIALIILAVCASIVHVKAQDSSASSALSYGGGSRWPSWNWPPRQLCWKRNEEYKACVSGSCSEWNCQYLYKGWPTACTYDCASGCFCKEGYFRNRRGKCVLGYRCFKEILPVVGSINE
uniref:TIL domain-containing protein n=1 Tax=Rhipicephalus microplus TaxID=6941 RepID=A0A6G5A5T6_RHIMP